MSIETEFVRRRGSTYRAMPLLRPLSRAGQLPDYQGALPQLSAAEQGAHMAVGHPVMYIVYTYHHDVRTGHGNWAFSYIEDDGELAPS